MSKLLFGADPECAAVYSKGEKLYALPPYYFREVLGVHSFDPIGDGRHPVFLQGDGWKAHEDGANFEFSLKPSYNPFDLFQMIQSVRESVESEILSRFPGECSPKLAFLPTVNWEVNRWVNMPDDFFMSTRFGCDPDEDVFNLQARCQVLDVAEHPERYCGGHIHISGSPLIQTDPHMAIKCMVVTAGVAATAFSKVPELEYARTFFYGRPGKFRIQNYGRNSYGPDYAIGIEYRTPSASWAGDWDVAEGVLNWAKIGIQNLFEEGLGAEILDNLVEPACEAILTANQESARQILSYIESKL